MKEETARISLMDGNGPRPEGSELSWILPAAGMTMEQLRGNYGALLRQKAVLQPILYQFTRELGSGRQGRVFLGVRKGARGCVTEYAVKVFDPFIYRSPEEYWTDMSRIATQTSRLQRLHSPNLVQRQSYEETYGIGYVEMEAIDGIDLDRLLSGRDLPTVRQKCTEKEWARFTKTIFRRYGERVTLQPGIAVYILRGVLRGLERLHKMRFLHSDVKPTNIMIDRLGTIKLIDFGRAAMAGEPLSFLLGSPLYMAPEIHRRLPGSPCSDVYSLGLVAMDMLRGERLIATEDISEQEILAKKLDVANRLQEILPSHVSENKHLLAILRRFVEPDPLKRYGSAEEAEVGDEGLRVITKQLVRADLDSEYARDLSAYLSKLVDPETDRVAAVPKQPLAVAS